MTTPLQSLPSGGHTREALAMREITETEVSPLTTRLLVGFFLIAIAVVPAAEIVYARMSDAGGVALAFEQLAGSVRDMRAAARPTATTDDAGGPWRRILAGNTALLGGLSGFESALEDESLIARTLRPPAQLAITARLGAGNERVYPGRDGWLFYRPDVEYLTGRPFLDPGQLRRRVKDAPLNLPVPQPDPVEAIIRFDADLKRRGIVLIVMPTPPKPAIHPDRLAGATRGSNAALENPSFHEFSERLWAAGVLMFDPRSAIRAAVPADERYLVTDTHWRPSTMQAVAGALARFITDRAGLAAVEDPGYRTEPAVVQNVGDTARMLDLPETATLFPPESVSLTRVLQADGSPWRSSRTGDVLVLGDSFSNIYSLASMGWGASAGFVEHVSAALRRPVDRLVQNDEGAFATRAMLARSPDRLDGKRVVVYQFAERELAFGDWKLIEVTAADGAP